MNISLSYTKCGSGEALLLLHGNGEDRSYFSHQIDFFSQRFCVYAIDTRGHGTSPRGTAPFTIAQFAEDLRRFMDEQGLSQANILGFSDGGNIALTFALQYPHRVRRLILNGANLYPSGVKLLVQLPVVLGWFLASRFSSPSAQAHAQMLALMVKEPHIAPQALSALTMPTLVIAGTRDMIRTSHTRKIAASIPGAQLVLLPGNHFIAHEKPAAFNAAVDAFLSRNTPKEGPA